MMFDVFVISVPFSFFHPSVKSGLSLKYSIQFVFIYCRAIQNGDFMLQTSLFTFSCVVVVFRLLDAVKSWLIYS